MEKTATLNVRVNPEVKREAEEVLDQLGLSMSQAINMYLRQIKLVGGIPFAVTLPEAPRTVDLSRMSSAEFARNIEEATAELSRGEGLTFDEAVAQIRGM